MAKVILVVEDEPGARLSAVDACERAGFEVADFGRADDALAFLERSPASIAAVLTDIDVPGDHDGIDLAVRMAASWPHIPVVVTSGRFGHELPEGLPPGVRYLPKPWTSTTLLKHVRAEVG